MQRRKTKFFLFVSVFVLAAISNACVVLKPYEQIHLRDQDMSLNEDLLDIFENNFHSYREGAVGGKQGNNGGGCSCN